MSDRLDGRVGGYAMEMLMAKKPETRLVGRDAETGHFKPVDEARKDKAGSVVERVPIGKKKGAAEVGGSQLA
jgi:hypothetical protein